MTKNRKQCVLMLERVLRDMQASGFPQGGKSMYIKYVHQAIALMNEGKFAKAHSLLRIVDCHYWEFELSMGTVEVLKAA